VFVSTAPAQNTSCTFRYGGKCKILNKPEFCRKAHKIPQMSAIPDKYEKYEKK
jgi:hypothetical protein